MRHNNKQEDKRGPARGGCITKTAAWQQVQQDERQQQDKKWRRQRCNNQPEDMRGTARGGDTMRGR
jgi:hypothetical protein